MPNRVRLVRFEFFFVLWVLRCDWCYYPRYLVFEVWLKMSSTNIKIEYFKSKAYNKLALMKVIDDPK